MQMFKYLHIVLARDIRRQDIANYFRIRGAGKRAVYLESNILRNTIGPLHLDGPYSDTSEYDQHFLTT